MSTDVGPVKCWSFVYYISFVVSGSLVLGNAYTGQGLRPIISVLGWLRQENHDFKARLDYIGAPDSK